MIAMIAASSGAGLGLSGFIVSMLVVGQLLGNLPASHLVSRAGERIAMLVSAGLAALGCCGILLTSQVWALIASALLIGLASATFSLARHSFVTTRVPVSMRARALSLLGGFYRAGTFLGPFLATLVLNFGGGPRSAVWLFIACLGALSALVTFGPDPERVPITAPVSTVAPQQSASGERSDTASTGATTLHDPSAVPSGGGSDRSHSMLQAFLAQRAALARLGVAAAALSGTRAARDVILPLWGLSLGLEAQQITLAVAISGAIDFALFYVSGHLMDRFGRLAAVLPSMMVMAAGFLVLSLSHDLPDAHAWYVACGVLLGLGNGLSSGILMTLGADLAPRANPAPFLGVWRTVTGTGGALLPLAVSGAAVVSLPFACAGVGIITLAGALGFLRWIPRYVPKAKLRG